MGGSWRREKPGQAEVFRDNFIGADGCKGLLKMIGVGEKKGSFQNSTL